MTTDEAQDRERGEGGRALPYARDSHLKSFWTAVFGGGFLAVIVSLFVALGISYRDYANSIRDNLESIAQTWNRNYEKIDERLERIERCIWERRCR